MSVRKPELYVPHCQVRTLCSMLRQSWQQASGSFTITVYMYTSHNCHVYELEAAVVLCGQIQPKITPCETKAGQRCYRETSQRRWACWLLNFLRIPDHTIFPQSHTKMTKLFSYLFEAQCAYVYLVRKATYQLIHPPLGSSLIAGLDCGLDRWTGLLDWIAGLDSKERCQTKHVWLHV